MSAPPKQYHNRATARGIERWDVDRLIEITRGMPVKAIPLEHISEYEEVYWFDHEYRPTCRSVVEHARRIEAVDLTFPIILSHTGMVMDGMHRVAKAHLLGMETIEAVQFERDPPPDAILDPPEG